MINRLSTSFTTEIRKMIIDQNLQYNNSIESLVLQRILTNLQNEEQLSETFVRYADHDSAEADPDGAYVDSADNAWGS